MELDGTDGRGEYAIRLYMDDPLNGRLIMTDTAYRVRSAGATPYVHTPISP